MERPKLRSIEAFPVELSGKKLVYLRDPLHYGNDVVVSPALIEVIRYFDGVHTIREIQAELMMRSGELIHSELIEKIIEEMDEHLLLESERFKQVRNRVESDFIAATVRQPAHAGTSYPAEIENLEEQLQSFFVAEDGAGLPEPFGSGSDKRQVRAVIAPHIDLRCAGPCYSWAYRELASGAADSETIIILGTSHYGTGGLFIVTEK